MKLKGEIISADSRQVYKRLDIGTGKITKKEMCGIPHHLLDVANPKSRFNLAEIDFLCFQFFCCLRHCETDMLRTCMYMQ